MDEIESKLLKEIEYFALHPERIGYNISIVNQLKAKLEQHRETKKWVEGLIEQKLKGSSDESEFALGWEHGLEELKKQISGEKNG